MRRRLIDKARQMRCRYRARQKLCRSNDDRWAVWLHKVRSLTYAGGQQAAVRDKATRARMVERGTVSLYYVMPAEWRREMPNALPE